SALTRTGELLGTIEYMAPEMAEGGKIVDARSDLYALGCTIYCLLVQEPPFPGSGPSVITKHLRATPEPPRKRAPDCHPELERIVLQLLAKTPADRGGEAADVAAALEKAARGSAAAGRSKLVPALVGGALVLAAVGAAAFFLKPAKTDATPVTAPTGPA